LGVGAALVVGDRASGGIIIASSIMMGRALAPIEIVLGTWKQLLSARGAVQRLRDVLDHAGPACVQKLRLPRSAHSLCLDHVAVAPPGSDRAVIKDVSFSLAAGNGLALLGASGCGKTSLAKAIVGLWEPVRGQVRLDGARLHQWDSDSLGRNIG
jgi:ABC-type protease/lipase transport system fused ATPase/permease subunit